MKLPSKGKSQWSAISLWKPWREVKFYIAFNMLHDKRMEDFIFPYMLILLYPSLYLCLCITKAILCLTLYIAPHDLNIAHSLPYFHPGIMLRMMLHYGDVIWCLLCYYHYWSLAELFEIYGKFNEWKKIRSKIDPARWDNSSAGWDTRWGVQSTKYPGPFMTPMFATREKAVLRGKSIIIDKPTIVYS